MCKTENINCNFYHSNNDLDFLFLCSCLSISWGESQIFKIMVNNTNGIIGINYLRFNFKGQMVKGKGWVKETTN